MCYQYETVCSSSSSPDSIGKNAVERMNNSCPDYDKMKLILNLSELRKSNDTVVHNKCPLTHTYFCFSIV